jgi:hypothetical protein
MSDITNRKACPKCGGPIQGGYVEPTVPLHAQIVFIVPGEPTKSSIVAAFKQGMKDTAPDQRFALRGLRCADCGFVEFFADESVE